jgi:hypothetical protein
MDGKTLALIFLGETKEKKKQQLYKYIQLGTKIKQP